MYIDGFRVYAKAQSRTLGAYIDRWVQFRWGFNFDGSVGHSPLKMNPGSNSA